MNQIPSSGKHLRRTTFSTIPFQRDPDFVQRNDVLTQLDQALMAPGPHKRAALYGIDGIGLVESFTNLHEHC